MKENKYKSIFDGLTDLEFEKILNDCGFKYTKVEQGKGGLYINGEQVSSKSIKSEYENFKNIEMERTYLKTSCLNKFNGDTFDFEYDFEYVA